MTPRNHGTRISRRVSTNHHRVSLRQTRHHNHLHLTNTNSFRSTSRQRGQKYLSRRSRLISRHKRERNGNLQRSSPTPSILQHRTSNSHHLNLTTQRNISHTTPSFQSMNTNTSTSNRSNHSRHQRIRTRRQRQMMRSRRLRRRQRTTRGTSPSHTHTTRHPQQQRPNNTSRHTSRRSGHSPHRQSRRHMSHHPRRQRRTFRRNQSQRRTGLKSIQ